ncbi:MAG: phosphatidylglycerophosphatase A [Rhodospirillaceae bacterium]|jgi:phosphatidylglycerophosphatase A|nr:phosphatidylglycerophosphatase A [Rhodospirillaceae bacterium]
MKRLNLLLLSWFGSGYSPVAPGTAGSIAALPFAWVIAIYWGATGLAAAALLVFFIGWFVCSITPEAKRDPGWVVIDEVAGQWLTLAVVPPNLLLYGLGFLLFRLFDILKPWPIRALEKNMPGGLGVMVDDIAAAVYAGTLLYGAFLIIGA